MDQETAHAPNQRYRRCHPVTFTCVLTSSSFSSRSQVTVIGHRFTLCVTVPSRFVVDAPSLRFVTTEKQPYLS